MINQPMNDSDSQRETMPERLQKCESRIGYSFTNQNLLHKAITHASSSSTRLKSYERLEFLGDSILGFIVCEYLFEKYPTWLEGELTRIKSVVVSRQSCAELGTELGLNEFLVVGKGIGNRGAVPESLLANAFESLLGAIYLDGGMKAAKKFLLPFVERQVENAVDGHSSVNFKSELQQLVQRRYGAPPIYQLKDQLGPDHEKCFCVAACVGRRQYAPAWGKNKKQAEQRAAANALAQIRGEAPPFCQTDPCSAD